LLLDRGESLSLFLGGAYLLLVLVVVVLRHGLVVVFPCGRVQPSQHLIGQVVLAL
jgi:hypothetical protein